MPFHSPPLSRDHPLQPFPPPLLDLSLPSPPPPSPPTMSAEAVVEVAIYMHRFHNLDLFQQGWYRIKVTSRWEGPEDIPGVPSRVVQYEAPEGTDNIPAIWQINDTDHSFCTRPFRIKYARQDVDLAVMISFHLSLRAVERLLLYPVTINFELLFAPIDMLVQTSDESLAYSSCANHEYRIPPKALLGLHAYCPVHFDAWHMVLMDVTVHSVLLKGHTSSFPPVNDDSGKFLHGDGIASLDSSSIAEAKIHASSEVNARDIALCKALHAAWNILKHELESMGSGINQNVSFEVKENPNFTFVMEKWNVVSSDKDQNLNGHQKKLSIDQNWSRDVAESLKNAAKPEDVNVYIGSQLVSRLEILETFQYLASNLSALWNTFLQFHRLHRSMVWEYLRGLWADERRSEWSLWLIHAKMDFPLGGSVKDIEGISHNMQLLSKPIVKKPVEEPFVVSTLRAEKHRKTFEQIKMNGRVLQDMQIFGMPSQVPILIVDSHTVPAERVVDDSLKLNRHTGSMGEMPGKHLTVVSGHGKVIRVVVFVHGFQGHHLDLRLARNQWLLIDPNIEFLMSEINEDRTTSDFRELGQRLAEEVSSFMKTKFGSFLKKATYRNCRLSFVGHSMGNIIIRAALNDPQMKPFLEYLHTFVSISGPHLGYLYSSNTLFNSGLWLLKKLKASPCMHQLTFTDSTNIQDCFLFKLSEEKSFEFFPNIILLSSPQDRYVPYHSARVEMCQAALKDSKRGPAYATMQRNCMQQILKPSLIPRNFVKCDVNFDTSSQARNLNTLIGRTAHIEFLETYTYLKIFMWTFPQYFS